MPGYLCDISNPSAALERYLGITDQHQDNAIAALNSASVKIECWKDEDLLEIWRYIAQNNGDRSTFSHQ
jgi:hypothetical protein